MMQTLGRGRVGRFNFLHRRTGTLWEGRHQATLVDTEIYLFACMRYIELNPVRARKVATPADHRWSSHRANAGVDDDDPVATPQPSFLAIAPSAARIASRCASHSFVLPSMSVNRNVAAPAGAVNRRPARGLSPAA